MNFFYILAMTVLMTPLVSPQAHAQSVVNAICSTDQAWCEMAAIEYQKATGIKVLQVRKTTGEAMAQLRAEANNPNGYLVGWHGRPVFAGC